MTRELASDDEAEASNRFAQSASAVLSDADSALPVLKEACHIASFSRTGELLAFEAGYLPQSKICIMDKDVTKIN